MHERVCKRTQVLTHEISTNSRSQTYLHDEENKVWRFLEESTEHTSVTEAIEAAVSSQRVNSYWENTHSMYEAPVLAIYDDQGMSKHASCGRKRYHVAYDTSNRSIF